MTKVKLSPEFQRSITNQITAAVQHELAPLKHQSTNWMQQIQRPADQPSNDNSNAPGINMARAFRALAAGRCDREDSILFATREYGPNSPAVKALQAGDFTAGGATIAQELSSELIELLRPRSIVRAMEPMTVRPTRGTLSFPKITSGASASYAPAS